MRHRHTGTLLSLRTHQQPHSATNYLQTFKRLRYQSSESHSGRHPVPTSSVTSRTARQRACFRGRWTKGRKWALSALSICSTSARTATDWLACHWLGWLPTKFRNTRKHENLKLRKPTSNSFVIWSCDFPLICLWFHIFKPSYNLWF